jgi:hypothetical protein
MKKSIFILCAQIILTTCLYAQLGNLWQWTGAINTDWQVAGNWNKLDPPYPGITGTSAQFPGQIATEDEVDFDANIMNVSEQPVLVTDVPTCSLGAMLVICNPPEWLFPVMCLNGAEDGVTITLKTPSPQRIAFYGDYWYTLRIDESCSLDLNNTLGSFTNFNRVKLIAEPGAHIWQKTGASFYPADYTLCDGQKGLLLEADAENHAEMVEQEEVPQPVKGWIEYYLPDGQYHYISPPVTSTWPATGEFANLFCRKHNSLGVFSGDYLRKFDSVACPPTGWCNWMGTTGWFDPALNIETGRGYEYYGTPGSDPVHAFYGTFNSGTFYAPITLPITSGGWNFIGNPFPSAIIFQTTCAPTPGPGWEWNFNYVDPVAYYWDNMMGCYQYYNWYTGIGNGLFPPERRTIPRSQGFFVYVSVYSPPSSDIKINNYARFFRGHIQIGKCLVANYLQVILNDGSGIYHDDAIVGFKNEANDFHYDPLRDAYKLYNDTTRISQLYFQTDDHTDVAMKTLKGKTGNVMVPLRMKVAKTGNYSLTFKDLTTFSPGTGISLKDNKTGTITDLTQSPVYHFSASAGDDDSRFSLCFTNVQNGIPDQDEIGFRVYVFDHSIFIRNNVPERISGTLAVYDLIGRTMMMEEFSIDGTTKIKTSLKSGIYILSVRTEKGIYNQKVSLE